MHLPRILPLVGAAAMSLFMLSATVQPVHAGRGADYRLTPTKTIEGTRAAADTLWRCTADGCSAGQATARPAIVCAQAAREFGRLENFTYRGEAIDADALAKCNAKAR